MANGNLKFWSVSRKKLVVRQAMTTTSGMITARNSAVSESQYAKPGPVIRGALTPLSCTYPDSGT